MTIPHIGRNDPCFCGSKKKYKKCCLLAGEASSSRAGEYSNIIDLSRIDTPLRATGRPQISTVYQGKRIRAVGGQPYVRPLKETFHEFLIFLLAPIFGGEWYNAEFKKPLEERHIVAQW